LKSRVRKVGTGNAIRRGTAVEGVLDLAVK